MNNENNGMQKRMLIMTLIVFVFFIAYEFLVLKPKQEAREAAANVELKKQQLANDKITDTIKDTATQAISAAEQANERIDNFVASYKK